jgi:hypothetical protein
MKDRQTKQRQTSKDCSVLGTWCSSDDIINFLVSTIQIAKQIDYDAKKLEDRLQNNDLSRTSYKITEGNTNEVFW